MSNWTEKNIPNVEGKVTVVTGANSGIGYEAARALADKGARVVMACRNLDKANEAARTIRRKNPNASVEVMKLNLGDLELVRHFAKDYKARFDRLDLLINNAGVMVPPYGKTKDGFEMQFGVNHLGHFALTGRLMETLLDTPGSRVVTVSSGAHRMGKINFNDLQWEREYKPWAAYGQSKLANLLFTFELQDRLRAAGAETKAVAAHPGYSGTNLQQHSRLSQMGNRFVAQSPAMGALPTLRAATASDVRGGDYYGPDGWMEMRGEPERVGASDAAYKKSTGVKLWEVSESLTGVHYDALQGSAYKSSLLQSQSHVDSSVRSQR